jgi:hypothetical protein
MESYTNNYNSLDQNQYRQGENNLPDETRKIICKMSEQLWENIKGFPMPENISLRDKMEFYRQNHVNYLSSLAKTSEQAIVKHLSYDISLLKKEIIDLSEQTWYSNVTRQNSYIVHKQTQSITYSDISIFYTPKDPFIVTENNDFPEKLKQYAFPIISDLQNRFNGRVAKCNLVRLNAGCFIPEHSDNFQYLRMVHRFHIPILTNENVLFKVGDQSINMKEGECFEIDVSLLHSVWNNGDTPRIHLIVDIMPNELIK